MKHVSFFVWMALCTMAITPSSWATEQIPDTLIHNGENYHIPWPASHSFPLEPFLSQHKPIRNRLFTKGDPLVVRGASTACWRRYVARWEVVYGRLYLKGIEMDPYVSKEIKGADRQADLNALFPKRSENGRVPADWFSGRLIIRNYGNDRRIGKEAPKRASPAKPAPRMILLTLKNGKVIKNDITLAQYSLSFRTDSGAISAYKRNRRGALGVRLIIRRQEMMAGTLLLRAQVQFHNSGKSPLIVPINYKTLKLQVVDSSGKPIPMKTSGFISGSAGETNQTVTILPGKESKRVDLAPASWGIPTDAGTMLNCGTMGCWILPKQDADYRLTGTLTVPKSDVKNQWHGELSKFTTLIPLTRQRYHSRKQRAKLIEKLGKQMLGQAKSTAGRPPSQALSVIDDDELVIPWYLKAMDLKNRSSRCRALDPLSRIDNPAVLPGLKKGMNTSTGDMDTKYTRIPVHCADAVRHSAAIALARTPLPEGKPLLRTMENDSYSAVRIVVIQAFSSRNTPENRSLLERRSRDPNPDVRTEAQRLLKKLQQKKK